MSSSLTSTMPQRRARRQAPQKRTFALSSTSFVIDNLYVDIKDLFDQSVDIRAGRQDFLGTYGEGFLIMDGTPQDGSRTFYFNAFKTAWSIDETNNLDFIYIRDPRYDHYLPVINEIRGRQRLNTTDEEAYVLYWKNTAKKGPAVRSLLHPQERGRRGRVRPSGPGRDHQHLRRVRQIHV